MRSLRDLQMRLYASLVSDRSSAAFGAGALGIPAVVRLEVYRNNLRETARKTLAVSYPVVAQLVGEVCFKSLARAYVTRFPSRCGDLAAFGREFPRLLEAFYAQGPFGYVHSVAALEWALVESESASEADPIDITQLSRFGAEDHERIVFRLHPSVRLVRSAYPVLSIWRAHQAGESSPVDLAAGGQNVLVYRGADGVALDPIEAGDADCIEKLHAGATLGQVQREVALGASIERALLYLHGRRLLTGAVLSPPIVSIART